jgi:hypothetical protein
MLDVNTLVEWLGPVGAKAGLTDSDLSLKNLIALARAKGLPLSPKPTREEVAHELVYSSSKRIERSIEDLLAMNVDRLLEYFKQVKPARTEIIRLLTELGVPVGSEASKNLFRFAAREIGDLGMYQRVAHGSRGQGPKSK